jgi:hypothetical protein
VIWYSKCSEFILNAALALSEESEYKILTYKTIYCIVQYCILGSSDFGTFTYFELTWIAEKIIRLNYKIHFFVLAVSCETSVFGPKKNNQFIIKSYTNFFLETSQYWYKKCQLTGTFVTKCTLRSYCHKKDFCKKIQVPQF